jgi:hypothetical protein
MSNQTYVERYPDGVPAADLVGSRAIAAQLRPTLPPGAGSSPRKFYFTYEDIARVTKRSVQTVRRWKSEKRFDPKDFASVAALLRLETGR